MIPQGKNYYQRGRKAVDSKEFTWVLFPDGNYYALAHYISLKYSPVFDDAGNITAVDCGTINEKVSTTVEEFLQTLKAPKAENTEFVYEGTDLSVLIFGLVKVLKALLEPNYEWTTEEWKQRLSFEPDKFGSLLAVVLKHLFGG